MSRIPVAVMLLVVPRGRGNWSRIRLVVSGPFDLFTFNVGDKLDIGGRRFWILEVGT